MALGSEALRVQGSELWLRIFGAVKVQGREYLVLFLGFGCEFRRVVLWDWVSKCSLSCAADLAKAAGLTSAPTAGRLPLQHESPNTKLLLGALATNFEVSHALTSARGKQSKIEALDPQVHSPNP